MSFIAKILYQKMNFFKFYSKSSQNLYFYYALVIILQSQNQLAASFSLKETYYDNARNLLEILIKTKTSTTTIKPQKQLNQDLDPYLYLNKFGYLDNSNDINSSDYGDFKLNPKKSQRLMMFPNINEASERLEMAIKKFQKMAHLNVTGILDKQTLRMMRVPRCGHPDFVQKQTMKQRRMRRYALQGSKWSKSRLSFKVGKYPVQSTMSRHLIDEELKRAFDLWSDVADVEFELVSDAANFSKMLLFEDKDNFNTDTNPVARPVDIEVRFETGYHGDSEPFDGSGLILGHAYFPEFGGSTHFDAEEFWTSRSHDGVNLYQVAVHEFGHALGLEHSENFDAIMAPFFRYFLYENIFCFHLVMIEINKKKCSRLEL